MTHDQITQLADQLLDGSITVEEATAQVAVAEVVESKNVSGDPLVPAQRVVRDFGSHAEDGDPKAACACERDRTCIALYLYREGVRPMYGADEDRDLAAGLRAYNALPKDERGRWLKGKSLEPTMVRSYLADLQYVAFVEESCPSRDHYVRIHTAVWNDLLRKHAEVPAPPIRVYRMWGFSKRLETHKGLVPYSTETLPSNEKYRAEVDRWDDVERRRLSWPLVAFEPGDAERGFTPDPTAIKSGSSLAREYAKPSVRVTTEYVKDDRGYVLLNADGSRQVREVEVPTMGAVEWEYRRRVMMHKRGITPTPYWMSPTDYKRVMTSHRARQLVIDRERLAKAERRKLRQLIRQFGGDPAEEKVVAWVRTHGVESCLASLRRREAPAVA